MAAAFMALAAHLPGEKARIGNPKFFLRGLPAEAAALSEENAGFLRICGKPDMPRNDGV